MPHTEYYEIGKEAYLYPSRLRHTTARKQREEPVRQWCAYELIRQYGISVNDIEFERKVQMASKMHPGPDIVVLRDRKPVVVVECKWRGCKSHERAMAQAVSYADAQTIRAEFAVYTNGEEWRVKRRIKDKWEVVPDIPRHADVYGDMPIAFLLGTINELAAVLYKLDDTVAGEDAKRFLDALQRFFHASNLLTEQINKTLGFATDNLLRSLSRFFDTHYCWGKLGVACESFEAYRQEIGAPYEIHQISGNQRLLQEHRHLSVSLVQMTERWRNLASADVLVLRLNVALLQYGQKQCTSKDGYPQIDQAVHDMLREYLDFALLHQFNAVLPDKLDKIWTGGITGYCKAIWDTFDNEPTIRLRDIVWYWLAQFRNVFRFRRD